MKNLNDLANAIARKTDTPKSKISVAQTRRVLGVAFRLLGALPACEAQALMARWMRK